MARRSKYKFGTSGIGDTITINGIDVYSMSNSLAGYNKRNKSELKYEQVGEPDKSNRYTFKRIA